MPSVYRNFTRQLAAWRRVGIKLIRLWLTASKALTLDRPPLFFGLWSKVLVECDWALTYGTEASSFVALFRRRNMVSLGFCHRFVCWLMRYGSGKESFIPQAVESGSFVIFGHGIFWFFCYIHFRAVRIEHVRDTAGFTTRPSSIDCSYAKALL